MCWCNYLTTLLGFGELLESGLWGNVASLLSLLLLAVSLHIVVYKAGDFAPVPAVLLFIVLVVVNPEWLTFSAVYPASFLLLWSIYCLVSQRCFYSSALLAAAILFYPPLLWLFPLMLLTVLLFSTDTLRNIVTSVAGFLMPFIYYGAFRWIKYNDLLSFWELFIGMATDFSLPDFSFHLTTIALFLYFLYVIVRTAVPLIRMKRGRRMRVLGFACYLLIFYSVALYIVCYGSYPEMMNIIPAMPAAILTVYHIGTIENGYAKRAERLLVAAVAVLMLIQTYL